MMANVCGSSKDMLALVHVACRADFVAVSPSALGSGSRERLAIHGFLDGIGAW
jgi:hypothetical protein